MNQWIGAVNSYYYPYMIYHVGHERNVFPKLGIEPDEKVVAHALPKIEIGLQVIERQLADGGLYLVGADPTIADYYLLPSTFSFARRTRARRCSRAIQSSRPGASAWRRCPRCAASGRRSRRMGRSSTPVNGPSRTGQNTDPARDRGHADSQLEETLPTSALIGENELTGLP